VRRREFICALAGAALVFPEDGRAQHQQALIGYLNTRSPEDAGHLVQAFRNGLAQNGYVEGRNLRIEYRWAFGEYERLPRSQPSLSRSGWRCWLPAAASPRHSRRQTPPKPSRSCFSWAAIQSGKALLKVTIGQAGTLPESRY